MKKMRWRYVRKGDHIHVRVFMNGANCGQLTFRLEEFQDIQNELAHQIDFVAE